MLITRTSKISGIERTIDLPITQEQLENWYNGMLVQDAFPNLTDSEREFILSGITDEEWDNVFPPETPNKEGIPTQPEYHPPSSKIYSTSNVSVYKFYKLRRILKYLNENIYLAGGSLRTILKCSGEQVSDFDFFFKSFQEVSPLRKRLCDEGWEMVFECPDGFLYTYKSGNHKLQLICETEYTSATALISSFDVSACMAAWHNGVLTFTREFVRSVKTKNLRTCNVSFPVATIKRLIKYSQKGYNVSIAAEDFCRQISGKVFENDQFRHYID